MQRQRASAASPSSGPCGPSSAAPAAKGRPGRGRDGAAGSAEMPTGAWIAEPRREAVAAGAVAAAHLARLRPARPDAEGDAP